MLIAAQIALTVTIFEGISPGGSDNLVVPLATYFLLSIMTPLPAEHVAKQLVAQLVITLLAGLLGARDRVDRISIGLRPGISSDSGVGVLARSAYGYEVYSSRAIASESSQTFRVVIRFHRAIAVITC